MEDLRESANIRQFITPAVSVQVEKHPSELILSGETSCYRLISVNDKGVDTEVIMFS